MSTNKALESSLYKCKHTVKFENIISGIKLNYK